MKKTLLTAAVLALAACGPARAADKVALIGHYDSLRMSNGEDPHYVSGYRLDLYRQGDRAFGSIDVADGSIELRSAELREVAFDEVTHGLRFKAQYAGGRDYGPGTGPDGREARTVLTFSGTVGPRAVVGEMGRRDAWCAACKPEVKRVSIRRTAETDVPQSAGR